MELITQAFSLSVLADRNMWRIIYDVLKSRGCLMAERCTLSNDNNALRYKSIRTSEQEMPGSAAAAAAAAACCQTLSHHVWRDVMRRN